MLGRTSQRLAPRRYYRLTRRGDFRSSRWCSVSVGHCSTFWLIRHARRLGRKPEAISQVLPAQSSGRAAKSFFVCRYHFIPDTGCLHLSCMLL